MTYPKSLETTNSGSKGVWKFEAPKPATTSAQTVPVFCVSPEDAIRARALGVKLE